MRLPSLAVGPSIVAPKQLFLCACIELEKVEYVCTQRSPFEHAERLLDFMRNVLDTIAMNRERGSISHTNKPTHSHTHTILYIQEIN